MTTNVLDLFTGVAATDSRWSIDDRQYVVYIDDVGFEKIVPFYQLLFVFAGDGEIIQNWKDWLLCRGVGPRPPTDLPDNRKIAVTVTHVESRTLMFEYQQIHNKEQCIRFAGSGAIHAYKYWLDNGDARMAVHYATTMDICSGGATKYFEFDTGRNNLRETVRASQLSALVLEKGYVMDLQTKQPVLLKEAALQDERIARFAEQIKSGTLHVKSPGLGDLPPWTEEKRQELYRVVQRELAKIGE